MKIKLPIFLTFSVLVIFTACQKDDDTPTPNNQPTSDTRAKYTGTWVVNENSTLYGTSAYQVDINPHSSISNRIVIDNFYNLGFTTSHAQVEVSNSSLNIIQQTISGQTISGNGTLNNSTTITLTYYANDGVATDTVNATYTKSN